MLALGYTKQNNSGPVIVTAAVTLNVTDVVLTQSAGEHKHKESHGGGEIASSSMRREDCDGCGLHCAHCAPPPITLLCPLSFNIGRGNLIVSSAARIIENGYAMFNGSDNTYEESVRGPASGLTSCHSLWCFPTSVLLSLFLVLLV